jgi:hypothetical protein
VALKQGQRDWWNANDSDRLQKLLTVNAYGSIRKSSSGFKRMPFSCQHGGMGPVSQNLHLGSATIITYSNLDHRNRDRVDGMMLNVLGNPHFLEPK